MASKTLYPPIVDNYMPAFVVGENGECTIYFSLSKFNSYSDFKSGSVQASITKQNTGMSVVDTTQIYHKTGIILNLEIKQVLNENNLYYIKISNSDLSSISGDYRGWIPGWIYKIQLRLSEINYNPNEGIGEATWLANNASSFSEWSTICIVKAIGKIDYVLPNLEIDTRPSQTTISSLDNRYVYDSFLRLTGFFENKIDPTELIHSYSFTLFDDNDNILEESGEIYSNQFQDNNTINYLMKTELKNNNNYKLAFKFITINNYEGGFFKVDDSTDERYSFTCSFNNVGDPRASIASIENNLSEVITDDMTTRELEENEGRVAIKFYSLRYTTLSGNFCIRRSSSLDNFQTWEDIYIYVCKQEDINDAPIFYDYTIESGVWYKYGVQEIATNGDRSRLDQMQNPVMRNFNYSYILGKNNQQLKLKFDNTMGSFKYQTAESKVDPIGAQYTDISRNAATYYKAFPINGLISFWMDENKLFIDKSKIYKYDNIAEMYENYNKDNGILQYDYIYEKQFRDAVLKFLYDGEYKLFKSPTEGNIIIRLMDVNCVPNQSLDRMIYSFSANAYEMDSPTMANYLKYGLANIGEYESSFAITSTKLGQLQMEIPVAGRTEGSNTDIIAEIIKKYDSGKQNIGGFYHHIATIHHIKITFDGKPMKIVVGNRPTTDGTEPVYGLGYVIRIGGQDFKILSPVNVFEFDERLIYTPSDIISVLGDADGVITTVPITVDFLYEETSDTYVAKQIQTRQIRQGIAQIYETCTPGFDLFKEIQYKYRIEWKSNFRKILGLSSIEIEANPGTVFGIQDSTDEREMYHVVGATGTLRLYEIENVIALRFIGVQNTDGTIDETKNADVLMNYFYLVQQGTYKE